MSATNSPCAPSHTYEHGNIQSAVIFVEEYPRIVLTLLKSAPLDSKKKSYNGEC